MRLTFLLILALSFQATAQVYKWTDAEGNTHFGSQPPPGQQEELRVRESSPGAMESSPKYRESDIIRQSRELERRERKQRYEAAKSRYERRISEIRSEQADRPDYVCTAAKNTVKDWEERWEDKRRQGYKISEETYYEQRIEEEERYRDSVCQ